MLGNRSIDYMRWFVLHVDELEPILGLPELLRAAGGSITRWQLMRASIDRIACVLADAPVQHCSGAVSVEEVRALQAELEARGLSWEGIARLVPILMDLVELLRRIELVYGAAE